MFTGYCGDSVSALPATKNFFYLLSFDSSVFVLGACYCFLVFCRCPLVVHSTPVFSPHPYPLISVLGSFFKSFMILHFIILFVLCLFHHPFWPYSLFICSIDSTLHPLWWRMCHVWVTAISLRVFQIPLKSFMLHKCLKVSTKLAFVLTVVFQSHSQFYINRFQWHHLWLVPLIKFVNFDKIVRGMKILVPFDFRESEIILLQKNVNRQGYCSQQ